MIAESFPATIPFRQPTSETATPLTVRDYYEQILLPDLIDLSPRSLSEDRIAINNWERYTADRPVDEISQEDLKALRDGMLAAGRSAPTVAKTWRELKAILSAACDDGVLSAVPKLKRRAGIVKLSPKRQRETVSEAELSLLWDCCKFASYPQVMIPAPKLWKVALVLFWTYGPRTLDLLQLHWEDIKFGDRLIQFQAMKTGKLQGLPMTNVVEEYLRSIRQGLAVRGHGRVFPGFNTRGSYLKPKNGKPGRWRAGFSTTWRREIFGRSGIEQTIHLKHFRERVVTAYNAISDGLGSWIAGHSMPGVSAMHYDLPTNRIRDAIEKAPVPECFLESV